MEGKNPRDLIDALGVRIVDALIEAQALNGQDMPTRSRDLSLCITKLEEAYHRIRDILQVPVLERAIYPKE